MSVFRDWAFALCAAMAAGGICRMVLPKSSMQRVFGITVSAFFLCVLLSPAIFSVSATRIYIDDAAMPDIRRRADSLTDAVNFQAQQIGLDSVEKIIREELSQMGINGGDAAINIITDGQHAPRRIEIVLDKEYESEHNRIRERLMNDLGLDIRLGYTQTDETERDENENAGF